MYCIYCNKLNSDEAKFCMNCGVALMSQGHPAGKPAGFWIRFFAELIDIVVVLVIANMCATATVPLLGLSIGISNIPHQAVELTAMLVAAFVISFYEIWMHVRFGRTLGKMAAGIKVVTVKNEPVTYKLSFLRWLGKMLNLFTLGFGFFMIVLNKDKRGVHDYVANTKVVYLATKK
ncbi:MAG: RDD family protein [Elusimicrobia bacterium]|nr:RDD family protein [Elusimicrobiota bacterium]